ncbi:hypothetical protein KAR91_68195, partial [Candidatus Pacearchaeota archaeon]|nr:hypothetical protein [Candidatus Pacearchaeota archaeon]
FLGQVVHYIDVKNSITVQGEITGINVSETGYVLIALLVYDTNGKSNVLQVESGHVFTTPEAALERLSVVAPLVKEANDKAEIENQKIEVIRKQIIGEPTYADFADRVSGKGQIV